MTRLRRLLETEEERRSYEVESNSTTGTSNIGCSGVELDGMAEWILV